MSKRAHAFSRGVVIGAEGRRHVHDAGTGVRGDEVSRDDD
jgi:hypothetical protein